MKTRPIQRPRPVRRASIGSLADLVGTLKKTVSVQLTRQFRSEIPTVLIRRAVDEAEHLAQGTGFPHLFLPELAAEQVRRVRVAVVHEEPELTLHRAA
jgi:hypothetical protein